MDNNFSSFSLDLINYFYSPNIPENNKSMRIHENDYPRIVFPYYYF